MLSYQHSYHAGNLADVQKHALIAWILNYLTKKDKPISYIESHAGRGLYDLRAEEAVKTGEAAQGIERAENWFDQDHPYRRALRAIQNRFGDTAYPGSPLFAQTLLRETDTLHLAELHPQEFAALRLNMRARNTHVYQQDGFALAQSLCPPTPRRGMLLVDPSYEVKSDYIEIPAAFQKLHKKWNVGILALWYPLLSGAPHAEMLDRLEALFPESLRHEVRFPPARKGHRMTGSGLFIINPPYGLAEEARALTQRFKAAQSVG